MLGRFDPLQKEVTVIGGGIAGLLAAYTLDKRGYRVTLYEEKERLGGLLWTRKSDRGLIENAAHSFLATLPVRKLCQDLGVDLLPVRPESKARFILRKGKLRKFPLTLGETLQALFRAFFIPSRGPLPHMTLADWGRHFLGEAALKNLLTPFVHGIHGVDPDQLTVSTVYPVLEIPRGYSFLLFFCLKRLRRGFAKKPPRPQMMAPRQGMSEWVDALEGVLRKRLEGRIHLGIRIKDLPERGNIVLAVPAESAVALLNRIDPTLSMALRDVRYAPLISVTTFVERKSLRQVPRGVGVLVAPGEQNRCLGILFNSSAFDGRVLDATAWVSCTLMFDASWIQAPEESIQSQVHQELQSLFGFQGEAMACTIVRHIRAIPVHNQNLKNVWDLASVGWCADVGHVLFGNYTGALSLRGMIEAMERVPDHIPS